MLSIRLSRVGKKKKPIYRVIVTEKSRDPWGKHLEILGWKNPHTKETKLNADRIKYWISKGAQPTETVHNLLVSEKIIEGKKFKSVSISKKRQGKMEAKKAEQEEKEKQAEQATEEAPTEAPAETPAEAPAAEVTEEQKDKETKEQPVEKTPETPKAPAEEKTEETKENPAS